MNHRCNLNEIDVHYLVSLLDPKGKGEIHYQPFFEFDF
jgi:hypothetical protein